MRSLSLMEYLLLRLAASILETDEESLLLDYKEIVPPQREKPAEDPETEKAVEEIYKAYPTRDPANNNRTTSKSATDKRTIRRLLKKHTKEELLKAIQQEVEQNWKGVWLKNFSTFLNHIPDTSEDDEKLKKPKYQ